MSIPNFLVKLAAQKKVTGMIIVVCSGITAVSMTITAGLQHNATKPLPILTIKHKHINTDTWIDVYIEKGSHGALRDLEYKHNNLGCLNDKGYHVRSVTTGGFTGDEPILELRNRKTSYNDFLADCKACQVSTELSIEGKAPKTVDWTSSAFAH